MYLKKIIILSFVFFQQAWGAEQSDCKKWLLYPLSPIYHPLCYKLKLTGLCLHRLDKLQDDTLYIENYSEDKARQDFANQHRENLLEDKRACRRLVVLHGIWREEHLTYLYSSKYASILSTLSPDRHLQLTQEAIAVCKDQDRKTLLTRRISAFEKLKTAGLAEKIAHEITALEIKAMRKRIEKIESGKLAGKFLQELGLDEYIK